MYVKPTELRLIKHEVGNQTFYTVNKIWDCDNYKSVGFPHYIFNTVRDASDWANREYHGVPFTRT